jgi:hypothetical protein
LIAKKLIASNVPPRLVRESYILTEFRDFCQKNFERLSSRRLSSSQKGFGRFGFLAFWLRRPKVASTAFSLGRLKAQKAAKTPRKALL